MVAPGYTEKWAIRKTLNRLETGGFRIKVNLKKYRYIDGPVDCECGEENTTQQHVMIYPQNL